MKVQDNHDSPRFFMHVLKNLSMFPSSPTDNNRPWKERAKMAEKSLESGVCKLVEGHEGSCDTISPLLGAKVHSINIPED